LRGAAGINANRPFWSTNIAFMGLSFSVKSDGLCKE
jgi:hypothetical protein